MAISKPAQELLDVLNWVFPHRDSPLQLHEPELTETEKAFVIQALDEGFVSYAGRQVRLFEQELARISETEEAVAVVSGTAALHVILHVLGIGTGDEVICPALTFVATANAISNTGASPHFVDCSTTDFGIDAARLDRYLQNVAERNGDHWRNRKTGRRIAAIMPVHIFGHVGDMESLRDLAEEWSLPIVEDATESLGSIGPHGPAGNTGLMAAVSFNGNKIVTTGGGGAILTNDKALAARLRHLTTTAKTPHPWHFHHDEIGFNYRMPNINAALGLAQLSRLPDMIARKRRLAKAYEQAFDRSSNWSILSEPAGWISNYWLNAVVFQGIAQGDFALENVLETLHANRLMCRPFWTPMHQLSIYADSPRDELPVTEALAKSVICLPSSPKLVENLAHG